MRAVSSAVLVFGLGCAAGAQMGDDFGEATEPAQMPAAGAAAPDSPGAMAGAGAAAMSAAGAMAPASPQAGSSGTAGSPPPDLGPDSEPDASVADASAPSAPSRPDASSPPATTPPAIDPPPLFPPLSTPAERIPSPDNPAECPDVAPENPWGPCAGLPVYVVCAYGTYTCICDWIHWICVG